MESIQIRSATVRDAERLLEIYTYYVENTAISFEYRAPTLAEFQARIQNTLQRYPYLVAEQDGVVLGYVYASAFSGRAAYDWSCALSIYLDPHARKRGLGRKLYEAIEEKLKKMGIVNLYACIAYPAVEDETLTKNSAEFHQHMGFQTVGKFHHCAYKFGRWYHMLWMEKRSASTSPSSRAFNLVFDSGEKSGICESDSPCPVESSKTVREGSFSHRF